MPASLSHVLVDFQSGIDSSVNLISAVKNLGINRIQLEIITELAFLRVFIAWENFLEGSFIRYSIGASSPSAYKPVVLASPQNLGHALDLISSGRDYVPWNSASEVIKRSVMYFQNGEPYRRALEPAIVDLNDMNTIRNRIVHKSTKSKDQFNHFIRRKYGHGISGMTPGRFLLAPAINSVQNTFLQYYLEVLGAASNLIVP